VVATTLNGVLLTGNHASRPAASAVAKGTAYACSTHNLIYQSDTSSWTTWFTGDGSGSVSPSTLVIPGASSPAQTAEGSAVWDTDDDKLTVGTGAARKTMVNEGAATSSGLTMATSRLLGRTTASSGAIEEITVGSGLSLSAGSLTATGGSSDLGGKELDYAQITSAASITNTSEGTADTVITGNAVSYDGSTAIVVEFFTSRINMPSTGGPGRSLVVVLLEGATVLGRLLTLNNPTTSSFITSGKAEYRYTPASGSRTHTVKAYVSGDSGSIDAGSGGSGGTMPAFLRIIRATS